MPSCSHWRTKAFIQWGYVIFSESISIKRVNKTSQKKITNIRDLGLNKLSLAEYKGIFIQSDLCMVYFKVNTSIKISS